MPTVLALPRSASWPDEGALPRAENRIYHDAEHVVLDLKENNMKAHERLTKLQETPDGVGAQMRPGGGE